MLKKFDQKITEGILFTDQYELVMAQLYFTLGLHEKKVQFDHYFRDYPHYGSHQAGYCINAGLEWLVDWMQNTFFTDKDIDYLKAQKTQTGKALFKPEFLSWLKQNGNFESLTLRSVPEGRVIHPGTPINIIEGPAAAAQIIETALLNQLNYQILIATKANRIFEMGRRRTLIDFGARRGQDRGAVAGVRAALIGGADFSSNVGISQLLGFPPKGTHAHSMVQMFMTLGMTEYDAFRKFADLYPDDCILLVDTVNTLESGIPNAIRVFTELKRKGHKPSGIRLDSGDLAYLSIKAAQMLNDAGLEEVNIVLSNELDEMNIWQIITQIGEEAPKHHIDPESIIRRLVYGVGTKLITSAGDSALGGVYKLTAVEEKGKWLPAIKISESLEKIPNPGVKRLWRIYDKSGKATADLISLHDEVINDTETELYHPSDQSRRRVLSKNEISSVEELHRDIFKEGKLVYDFPPIEEIRETRDSDTEKLDAGVKRLILPHTYHVSLTKKLWDLKQEMLHKVRENI